MLRVNEILYAKYLAEFLAHSDHMLVLIVVYCYQMAIREAF